MPDSGMVNLGHHHGHGAQPPFYSPPAPPPPSQYHHHHHPHHLHNNSFNQNDQMEGNSSYHLTYQNSNQEENNNPVGIMQESDSNGNGNGGNYPRNNPNDPNNNQGMMIMLMEEDGHGGHGPPQHQNGGDMVVRDLFEEIRNGGGHWSQLLRQVVLTPPQENGQEGNGGNNDQENYPGGSGQGQQGGSGGGNNAKEMEGGDGTSSQQQNGGDGGDSHVVPLQIVGGSENGQFVYVGITNPDINGWITVGYLQPGDILLEIQGQQVAGYTQADVISLLHHCLRGNSATLTVAPRGSLGPELRSYLNTRFQKGSVDHALQGVVRDNLYLRTVPVTTRTPRPGETNGVDYTFLSVEEFMQLEREGSLLESGVYAGNHYGTPKPWARLTRGVITSGTSGEHGGYDQNQQQQQELMEGTSGQAGGDRKGPMLPGMHPSSEGKRRRNRSNVEALGAGAGDEEPNLPPGMPSGPQGQTGQGQESGVELGPLPANWEMAYTDNGEVYFIDHNTGTSHWLDPRLSRVQKLSLEDCAEDELPFGWERIEDPHYGVYYIDHVNRRTQFENPVIQAKASQQGGGKGDRNGNGGNGTDDSEADSTSRFLSPEQQYNSQYAQPPPMQYPPNPPPQQFSKRPTSLAKPVPPIPNPKPQNPHRLSLAAKQQQNSVDNGPLRVKPVSTFSNRFFTRDPTQLIGERITTTLVKSSRGLGFTIVGGDDDDGLDEFLQIKSVVAEGPAWIDGKLRTGDVLVKVNGTTVLGYTHQEMVSIFQSISPGEDVQLEVCRGYPLPFDPSDPNTEIVTTVAVAMPDGMEPKGKKVDWARSGSPDSCTHSAHSLPELGNNNSGEMGIGHGHGLQGNLRPASVDLLLDGGGKGNGGVRFPGGMFRDYPGNPGGQESRNGGNAVLTVNIVKGVQGFGFTIADSVTGQKVKKVLDSGHCGELEEGDRLIALDGLDLRGLSHTQVVQILKDFPVGREASLTIQRSPPNSPYGNTGSSVDGQGQAANFFGNGGNRPLGISPRSKTPTAEMGRQRHRLPERSKTPQGFPGEGYSGGFPGAVNGELSDLSREWVEMSIELERRQEGFGFRIVGGTEEGSQVSVGHIVPGGAANLDGRLQSGDQLLAVDGISVVGASHRSVVQLMARSAGQGKVGLTVRRNVGSNAGVEGMGGSMVMTPVHSPGGGNGGGGSIAGNSVASGGSASPIHVTLRRQPSEGFGFVIISSASKAGATIGKIVGGSPADRCGELRVGDRILAVNNLDISQLHHTQVVQLIKESGFMLTLSVLPVGNGNGNGGSVQMQQSSPMIGGGGGMEGFGGGQEALGMGMEGLSLGMGKGDEMDDGQVFGVQLARGNRGFGFSIRGGKEFQNMPLFVLRLAEDGPAAIDGRMLVGDQIVQINGINTGGMTHAEAIHLIKTGGASVHLLLRRGSVPFPFLSQVPGMAGGGFVGANGQEMEEQSLSNASNNNEQQQQFLNMSMNMNQNQQQQQHQNSYQFQYHHQNNAGF